jgi:hypothetical protein
MECGGRERESGGMFATALVLAALTLTPDGAASFLIKSQILGETRRVFVQMPKSFSNNARRYPTVIAFDGELVFRPLVTTRRRISTMLVEADPFRGYYFFGSM